MRVFFEDCCRLRETRAGRVSFYSHLHTAGDPAGEGTLEALNRCHFAPPALGERNNFSAQNFRERYSKKCLFLLGFCGSPGWNRTNDQRINSPTLYR